MGEEKETRKSFMRLAAFLAKDSSGGAKHHFWKAAG
jgi:hypothetical protein